MIERHCQWCGYRFDASFTYKHERWPGRGSPRRWCRIDHRAKSQYWRRKYSVQQKAVKEAYTRLEQHGQMRFF